MDNQPSALRRQRQRRAKSEPTARAEGSSSGQAERTLLPVLVSPPLRNKANQSVNKVNQSVNPHARRPNRHHTVLPVVPSAAEPVATVTPSPCGDTSALWDDYQSRASAQQIRLARAPRWRAMQSQYYAEQFASASPAAGWMEESARKQRHRDLRRQLREADLDHGGKRDLVGVPLPPVREASKERSREHHRQLQQEGRIQGVMQDCSQARSELVALQRVMARVNYSDRALLVDEPLRAPLGAVLAGVRSSLLLS